MENKSIDIDNLVGIEEKLSTKLLNVNLKRGFDIKNFFISYGRNSSEERLFRRQFDPVLLGDFQVED